MCACAYMHACVCTHHSTCAEVRGQLLGVSALHPSIMVLESELGSSSSNTFTCWVLSLACSIWIEFVKWLKSQKERVEVIARGCRSLGVMDPEFQLHTLKEFPGAYDITRHTQLTPLYHILKGFETVRLMFLIIILLYNHRLFLLILTDCF